MKSELLTEYKKNVPSYYPEDAKRAYFDRIAALEKTPYEFTDAKIKELLNVDFYSGGWDAGMLHRFQVRLRPIDYALEQGAKVETWTDYRVDSADRYMVRLANRKRARYSGEELQQLLLTSDGTFRCFFSQEPFPLLERAFPEGVYARIQQLFWEDESSYHENRNCREELRRALFPE
jgi:hypothetical protein